MNKNKQVEILAFICYNKRGDVMFVDTHMHIGDFGIEPDLYVKNALDNNVKILIIEL